jgi:ribosomal protein S27AE
LSGRQRMIGDAAQYQELVTLYESYGDEELMGLARGMDDLTEMAQEALRGEIARRGLKLSAPERAEARVLSEDDLADLRGFAALAPAECVFEYEDERGASAASLALREAGIECVVLQDDGSRIDTRGPRVVVAPEDAEEAAVLLSQALTEGFRTEADEVVPEEFEVPACPKCGSHETLLEAVEPANRWLCDGCGHEWLEEDVAPEV